MIWLMMVKIQNTNLEQKRTSVTLEVMCLGGVSIPSDRLHLPCAHFHNFKKKNPEKTGFNLLYKQWSSKHEKRRPACVFMKHCTWWLGHCIDHRTCVKMVFVEVLDILVPTTCLLVVCSIQILLVCRACWET